MHLDVLAIGAHPDDVELGVGGLLHKLSQQGYSVGILDLTRGELASRGTVAERMQEADQAALLLGITVRENAELPDGEIANTKAQQQQVIPFLRKFKPRIILTHLHGDRHPDHTAAHHLVRDANFFAGLAQIDTGEEPYRASACYYFKPYSHGDNPPFIIDISHHFEAKLEALQAYRSQFHNPHYEGVSTWVSSSGFWDAIQHRAAYWGNLIGTSFGEPLFTLAPVALPIPVELLSP